MSRAARTRLAALLVPLFASAAPARAQRIDGMLLSARDSTPLAGALVQLVDSGGVRVGQTSSGTDGSFRLAAPAGGRYVVAVLRIGQHPWRSAPATLAGGLAQRLTLLVPDAPVELAAVSVEARSSCRVSPNDQSLIGNLLAEAEKALIITRLAVERSSGYGVQLWRKTLTPQFAVIDSTPEYVVDARWPIRSAPAESLAAHGFVRQDTATVDHPNGVTTYYGPDAATLFSLWFLDTHCFRVLEGTGTDRDAVLVAFEPARGRHHADIEGRLVIERSTLALRRIEWRYVGLPWWVTAEGAGGELNFIRLGSGLIFPWYWWTRAPIAEVNNQKRPVRIAGWVEAGGEALGRP